MVGGASKRVDGASGGLEELLVGGATVGGAFKWVGGGSFWWVEPPEASMGGATGLWNQ